jgi:hypothetical protein
LSVRTADDIDSSRRRELERADVAKAPNGDVLESDVGGHLLIAIPLGPARPSSPVAAADFGEHRSGAYSRT